MQDWKLILINYVIPIVSLAVSLAFGWYAIASGKSHSRQIASNLNETKGILERTKAQGEAIAAIQGALSTRYIGVFPEYLPDIVSLIESAKEEILIFCDFPAYGRISDHHNWLAYRQAIERKLRARVRVSLTCLNKASRQKYTPEQFAHVTASTTKWKAWKQGPAQAGIVDLLAEQAKGAVSLGDLDKDRLFELLEVADARMLDDVFGAQSSIKQTDGYMPVFVWLVDQRTAIFAFPVYMDRSVEQGFYTTDPRLISALEAMRLGYHQRGLAV